MVNGLPIVYSTSLEAEEGIEIAEYLDALLPEEQTIVAEDRFLGKNAIRITHPEGMGLWNYELTFSRGTVILSGGSCWAMRKAAQLLVEDLASSRVAIGYTRTGSVEGEFLFPIAEGADLRILDDNIWDYSKDTIPPVWKEIGYDCRDANRGPQFAQMVRAYMPDVLTIQEYNVHMDNVFYPLIAEYGYVTATTGLDGKLIPGGVEGWNNTPIFYDKNKVELLDAQYCLYTPTMWSNHGSKSFTSAVFRRLSDQKVFAVINTHLWWKSDKAQPGSSQARASQVRLMIAQAQIIKGKYNCPVFVTGDMNAEENTVPIQQFITSGFKPCYKVATSYGDNQNGHHICGPNDGYSRVSRRKGETREVGAIDHCFIWNEGEAKVVVFDCLTPYFTVPLTDHYPNLIDAKL